MNALKHSIRVFAPATCANVACGFDIFGFALNEPGDEVEMKVVSEKGVKIRGITGDNGKLPTCIDKNAAGFVAQEFLKQIDAKHGVEIVLNKKMPIGSGLGSSSASAVASAIAVNELFGNPLNKRELLALTMKSEELCSGSAHADNVAPALFGGFVLIRSYDPLDVIEVPTPGNLFCAIVHPNIEIRTEDARNILPKNVPMEKMVKQTGNAAGLVVGLMTNNHELIRRSLVDHVIEQERSKLIPSFDAIKQTALAHGALGASISGSGPSVFALTSSQEIAEKCGSAMQAVLNEQNITNTLYISAVNTTGAHATL